MVTVFSVFGGGGVLDRGPEQEGAGSGFVLDGDGEIATNAHVVTTGAGRRPEAREGGLRPVRRRQPGPARRSSASIPTPTSPSCAIDPAGLTLRPLPLGSSRALKVGAPVVAIGSPVRRAAVALGRRHLGPRPLDRVAHRLLHRRRDPDRRRDQPRQLRRPAVDAARPGARDQLADPLDGRRRRGRRLRGPGRHASGARSTPLRADGEIHYAFLGVQTHDDLPAARASASTCPSTRAPGCRT